MDITHSNEKPEILRFAAQLYSADTLLLIDVPKEISEKLRGLPKVEGTINNHPFRTTIEPNESGGLRIRVNSAMSRGANAAEGDSVELAILGPETEVIPDDLKSPLTASPEATEVWQELTPLGRLDWIRWINGTKNPETRSRRITRTVDQLAEGKRRACCVNVNEYMLCRIEEDELKALNQSR